MQLRIRRRDRAATVAHYRHLEEALGRELESLLGYELRLHYEMAVGGGWDFREEGSVKDRHPTPMLEEILASGRAVYLPG